PNAFGGSALPAIGSSLRSTQPTFCYALSLRLLARPLQKLLKQSLLLGRIVRRRLGRLLARLREVDAGRRLGRRGRRLPLEPLLPGREPRPAGNVRGQVHVPPARVTRRLPQLVEVREEGPHEFLDPPVALGARRPVVSDQEQARSDGFDLCAPCD